MRFLLNPGGKVLEGWHLGVAGGQRLYVGEPFTAENFIQPSHDCIHHSVIFQGCYRFVVMQREGRLTLERKGQKGGCIVGFDIRSLSQFLRSDWTWLVGL